VKDAILSFQEKALQSTKHKIVAIYSMMIVSYRLPAPASKSAEWIKKHLKLGITRKFDGLNCLCFFESCSFDFYPDPLETRNKDNTRASLAKVDFLNFMNAENKSTQHNPLINKYRGFDLDDIPKYGEYKKCSIFIYTYDSATDRYSIGHELSYINPEFEKIIHKLYITNEDQTEAHFLHISDPDKLVGGKVCPYCAAQWFNMKDKNRNFERDFKRHTEKCKANGGKIIKEIKLDHVPMPYIPHLNNKEKINSIVKNVPYKYNRNYILYDFETCGVKINEKFGKKSELLTQLEPITVASVVFRDGNIESKCFSIKDSIYFVRYWIEYLFEKGLQMSDTNETDEDEHFNKKWINVLGYNSVKFDFVLLLPHLQSDQWSIVNSSFIGTPTKSKQIVVRHNLTKVELRFLDVMMYAPVGDL
jgi:hypothetical protein